LTSKTYACSASYGQSKEASYRWVSWLTELAHGRRLSEYIPYETEKTFAWNKRKYQHVILFVVLEGTVNAVGLRSIKNSGDAGMQLTNGD